MSTGVDGAMRAMRSGLAVLLLVWLFIWWARF